MGALQNAKYANGSIATYLYNSQSISNSPGADIARQRAVAGDSCGADGHRCNPEAQRGQANALPQLTRRQTNYNPPKELDPFIYFSDGSSIDTANNIMTLSNGTQIDTTTGLQVIDTSSIINMANGAYLDTKNNILTMADGTKIDTVTGLIKSRSDAASIAKRATDVSPKVTSSQYGRGFDRSRLHRAAGGSGADGGGGEDAAHECAVGQRRRQAPGSRAAELRSASPMSPPASGPISTSARETAWLHFPIAAVTSLIASSLAHSAGPASVASSQPFGSTISVVGMPKALPIAFRSWNTLAVLSA